MFVRIEHDLGVHESAGDVLRTFVVGKCEPVDLRPFNSDQRFVAELLQRDEYRECRIVCDRKINCSFEYHLGPSFPPGTEATFFSDADGFARIERERPHMTDSVSYHMLSACPADDAVRAWNDGFAGYFSDMTVTRDVFERRLRQDGIVAEASFLAYAGERPVGLALNAIGDVHGIRQAWNGGTAVAEDFRGTGVGRELIRRSVELYGEHRVDLATLEARSENERAMALYSKFGYRRNGELHGLAAHGPQLEAFGEGVGVEFVAPERLTSVPFYQKNAQWSTLWPNATDGTAVIVVQRGAPFAYVLFRRTVDKKSGEPAIRILQAACADDGTALRAGIGALFAHHRDVTDYLAYNIPGSNKRGLEVLREAGFEPVWDQVWMVRESATAR